MRGGPLPHLIAGGLVVAVGATVGLGLEASSATGGASTPRHLVAVAPAAARVLPASGVGKNTGQPNPPPAPGGGTATPASDAGDLVDAYAGTHPRWAFTQIVSDRAETRITVESTTGPPPALVRALRTRGLSRYVTYRTVKVSRSSFPLLANRIREATKTATVPVSVISLGADADSINVSFRTTPTAGDLRLLPKLPVPVHYVGVADPIARPALAWLPGRRTTAGRGGR